MYTAAAQTQVETKNPRVNLLVSKWQQVWLLALDRRRKLNDALDRLEEVWPIYPQYIIQVFVLYAYFRFFIFYNDGVSSHE